MGADSRPQRALSSPTAAPAAEVPVTITAATSNEAETQQPSAAPALSTANNKPGTTGCGAGSSGPGWPHIGVACLWGQEGHCNEGFGNNKMVQCKKQTWLRQQELPKDVMFVWQTAVRKNNPRKHLVIAGDGEMVESDDAEGEKGAQAARVGKRMRHKRVLPEARPNSADPITGHSSHLTT